MRGSRWTRLCEMQDARWCFMCLSRFVDSKNEKCSHQSVLLYLYIIIVHQQKNSQHQHFKQALQSPSQLKPGDCTSGLIRATMLRDGWRPGLAVCSRTAVAVFAGRIAPCGYKRIRESNGGRKKKRKKEKSRKDLAYKVELRHDMRNDT